MSTTSTITLPPAPSESLSTLGGDRETTAAGSVVGFEGPEKTIEIDFVVGLGPAEGIRALPRRAWDEILGHAACTILVEDRAAAVDSYVLSESSLFVFQWKVLIKTCGTTTLLLMLPELLKHAKDLGMAVEWMAYTRKDFLFPLRQKFPHRSFEEEIGFLSAIFPDGHAHILGPLTRDHWFMFVVNRGDRLAADCRERTLNLMMYDVDPDVAKCFYREGLAQQEPRAAKLLQQPDVDPDDPTLCRELGDVVTKHLRLDELLPGSTTQSWLFEPCGWSLNGQLPFGNVPTSSARQFASSISADDEDASTVGSSTPRRPQKLWVQASAAEQKEDSDEDTIVGEISLQSVTANSSSKPSASVSTAPQSGGSYWTVHVTPEHHCSYVSFETNAPLKHYKAILRGVLSLFRPKRFSMTLFADKCGLSDIRSRPHEHGGAILQVLPSLGYARLDLHSSDFVGDYTAILGNYAQLPSDVVREGGTELCPPAPWEVPTPAYDDEGGLDLLSCAETAGVAVSPWEMARLTKSFPTSPIRHRSSSIS